MTEDSYCLLTGLEDVESNARQLCEISGGVEAGNGELGLERPTEALSWDRTV